MNVEIDDILEQIARAQSAWDQYNIQSWLPTDPRSLAQGNLWDAFNNGERAAQARRDPAASSAAWNALEQALLELANTANRITLSCGDLDASDGFGTCGRGARHGGAGREPRRCPRRMTARMRCRRPR